MQDKLYQYLLAKRKLALPGVGTLLLQRVPASIDIIGKQANAPVYSIVLEQTDDHPSAHFVEWLAVSSGISGEQAVEHFNQFSDRLKKQVEGGENYSWDGVGVFGKNKEGALQLDPFIKDYAEGPVVPAVKVIRDNATHTIRVGEQEKSSSEMLEMLYPAELKKSSSWIWALAIGVLALIIIIYFLSVKGFSPAATGNSQKVTPQAELPSKQ